jgi:hypothetical protein
MDLAGPVDHMVVGDDIAGGIDDEAGAERRHVLPAAITALLLAEMLEELLEGRAGREIEGLCLVRRSGGLMMGR